jgi:hypothetical protein
LTLPQHKFVINTHILFRNKIVILQQTEIKQKKNTQNYSIFLINRQMQSTKKILESANLELKKEQDTCEREKNCTALKMNTHNKLRKRIRKEVKIEVLWGLKKLIFDKKKIKRMKEKMERKICHNIAK